MSNMSRRNEGIKDINKYYNYFDIEQSLTCYSIQDYSFLCIIYYNENFLWLTILWYKNIACTTTHRNIA